MKSFLIFLATFVIQVGGVLFVIQHQPVLNVPAVLALIGLVNIGVVGVIYHSFDKKKEDDYAY